MLENRAIMVAEHRGGALGNMRGDTLDNILRVGTIADIVPKKNELIRTAGMGMRETR